MRDLSTQTYKRGVAQPGSAPPWGGGGRRFKSSRPDQHPCWGVRIPGPSSSMTPGVRRLRVEPSRPDQHLASLPIKVISLRTHVTLAEEVVFQTRMAHPSPARFLGQRWDPKPWRPRISAPFLARALRARQMRAQFCSRQNCLCTSKEKFDGIEFGRPKAGPSGQNSGMNFAKVTLGAGREHPVFKQTPPKAAPLM